LLTGSIGNSRRNFKSGVILPGVVSIVIQVTFNSGTVEHRIYVCQRLDHRELGSPIRRVPGMLWLIVDAPPQ
jgi:hypothetical protein